jgi:Protein of unknown function (DUF4239)
VNLLAAAAIVVAAAGLAIGVLLLARRRAPDGGFYTDGDRAAGVFGVLATGFAVLLGLVVVLAFTSYDASRAGAETEAITVGQQYEVANLLPEAQGRRLAGELVCYARSVVYEEWPRMQDGSDAAETSPWGLRLYRTLRTIEPRTAAEQAAYAKWLDLRLDRETARNARLHGASGVIPAPLWLVLAFSAVMIVGFMVVFADSGERAWVQAMFVGSIVVVIVGTLLLIRFLDDPYDPGLGALKPVAMQRTLEVLDEYRSLVGDAPMPCDERGRATT